MLTKKLFVIFVGLLICNIVFAASVVCTDTKTECVQKGSTRYFDGVAVTLPCWQYKITRKCTVKADNNCQPLRDQGCVQVDAKCRIKLGDVCVVQDKIYSCPVKKCSDSDGIICGGSFYCMSGDCSSHDPVQNKDFDKAVAGMSAVGGAAEDIKKSNGVQAFAGQGMQCSEDMIGFKNCCADHGWGKDIGLAHCTDEEKNLGKSKGKKVTVYVGRYCHNRVLGVCTSHHKVYCVFGSKLARIIQKQGRLDQLHIPFGHVGGDDDNVDCRGLTPAELSKIDFSRIDFHDIYKDIESNTHFPKSGSTEQKIAKRVKDFYDHHKKHS